LFVYVKNSFEIGNTTTVAAQDVRKPKANKKIKFFLN